MVLCRQPSLGAFHEVPFRGVSLWSSSNGALWSIRELCKAPLKFFIKQHWALQSSFRVLPWEVPLGTLHKALFKGVSLKGSGRGAFQTQWSYTMLLYGASLASSPSSLSQSSRKFCDPPSLEEFFKVLCHVWSIFKKKFLNIWGLCNAQ